MFLLQFSVIIFNSPGSPYDGCVQVVPKSWLLNDRTVAYWPTFKKKGTTDTRTLKIRSLAPPEKTWPTIGVKHCHNYSK